MSSRLLPHNAQVATPEAFVHALLGSRLISEGSMQVAAWEQNIPFNYGVRRLTGSRCSTFFKKLYARKKRRGKERIRVTIGVSCYTCYPGIPRANSGMCRFLEGGRA